MDKQELLTNIDTLRKAVQEVNISFDTLFENPVIQKVMKPVAIEATRMANRLQLAQLDELRVLLTIKA